MKSHTYVTWRRLRTVLQLTCRWYVAAYLYRNDSYVYHARVTSHTWTKARSHVYWIQYSYTFPQKSHRYLKVLLNPQKNPAFPQKSPTSPQTSLTFPQKSHRYLPKSPLYLQKSPRYPQKSHISPQKSPTFPHKKTHQRGPRYPQKSPISTKEPYISTKKPCISAI